MANDRHSPIRAMFEVQRQAIRQGQRAVEQNLEFGEDVFESVLRTNLATGRAIGQGNADAARNWMDAYFGALGAVLSESDAEAMRSAVDDQFAEFDEAQREAWASFGDSVEDAVTAYGELTDSQRELIDRSVTAMLETGATVGRVGEEPKPDTARSTVEREPAEPPTEADSAELEEIPGIGAAYARRLHDAGIETIEQLARADAGSLADELDVSENRLAEWIDSASQRQGGGENE